MSFRKNILFVLTLSLLVTESLWASSNGAQTGRSGRPGDGAGCAYCHTAVSDPALSPTITFSQSEDTLSVGESLVFNLDIESNDNTKSGFGFNIAVADTAVGVFATSASVRLNNADNSEVTHQQTYNYSDGAGSIALQFTPASVGEHTLYVVLNEVNGEWNISDDAWSAYTGLLTLVTAPVIRSTPAALMVPLMGPVIRSTPAALMVPLMGPVIRSTPEVLMVPLMGPVIRSTPEI